MEAEIGAELIEARAELKIELHEVFCGHPAKAAVGQGLANAAQQVRQVFELFFVSREKFFLEFLVANGFEDLERVVALVVPTPEGGFWNFGVLGNFAKAPALAAEDGEPVFFVCGVHGGGWLMVVNELMVDGH